MPVTLSGRVGRTTPDGCEGCRNAADPAVGDGGVREEACQAAELLLVEPALLPDDEDDVLDEDEEDDEDDVDLLSELLDEELDASEEAVFAGVLLDDEPRLSLR
jgi:hypothetical protein